MYKEVPLQGVSIFALKESYKLAQLLGKEKEVADLPQLTDKMIKAARKNLYNRKTGLFVGTGDKQISYASQIWMILSGVASKAEGKKALSALTTTQNVCYPGTPYMYHYYIQSLIECGMNLEAKEALVNYWGGMITKGADTFWEAYDPTNDFISPYDFYPINSYCHAWSCTLFILSGNTLKYFRSDSTLNRKEYLFQAQITRINTVVLHNYSTKIVKSM